MIPREKLLETLRRHWGYERFRPLQLETIEDVCAGRDTLVLMPTGGGKSVVYQVPALASEGVCVVVTPLIALMKDQIDRLRSRRILAESIHSGMSPRDIDRILDNCVYGSVKFLYITPERIDSESVPDPLRENARVVAGRRRGALHLPMGLRLPALLSAYRAAAGAAARHAGPRADRFGDARGRRGHHAPPEVPQAARPPHEFRAGEPELCRAAHRGQARSTAAHRRKRARPGHRLCPHPGKGRNDRGFSERARHSGRILSRRHELPDALRASGRVDQRNDARHGRNQRIRHGDRQGRRPFRRALRCLRLARGILSGGRARGTRRQTGLRRHAAFGRRRIESGAPHGTRLPLQTDDPPRVRSAVQLSGRSRRRRPGRFFHVQRVRFRGAVPLFRSDRLSSRSRSCNRTATWS